MDRKLRRRNLRRLIDELADGNQARFAEQIGRTPSYVGQLVRGVGSFGERVAREIESRCRKPVGWLDGLEDSVPDRPAAGCPLLSWVAAGSWQPMAGAAEAAIDAEDWLQCPVRHGPGTFVLRVRGESMYNPAAALSFADGDLIFVDPDRRPENRACVVVRREDEHSATFKQLVLEGEGPAARRYLKPLNPAWPEPIIELTPDARLCGVVIFKGTAL